MAEARYAVFVRVPIPRGDFVDPPPVDWDSAKDDALWKFLSGAAQTEVDWHQVADHFKVSVDFLLQQIAYITERHASQVRAQVRKAAAAAKVGSASPIPTGTESAHHRTASALSIRRDSPLTRYEGSGIGTPLTPSTRPLISRNASTNTTVLRDTAGSSPKLGPGSRPRQVEAQTRKRLSSLPIQTTVGEVQAPSPGARGQSVSPGPPESEVTSSSDDESSPAQSRIIRRPPRFQQNETKTPGLGGDDEDDSEPAFQSYKEPPGSQDLASTLRGDLQSQGRLTRKPTKVKDRAYHSQTSDDSGGSGALISRPGTASRDQRTPGPLSPKRKAELARRSPSGKGKGHSQEGSDGTPSMGSSFSDLDDASVTQSALEEALASHMNGAGSRFSISQAFRSRYNSAGNPSGNTTGN